MPYSISKKLEHKKKMFINNIGQKFYDAATDSLEKTVKDLYKEGSNIFDNCITQFYNYETQKYYRHETGRGTRTGMNLYRANQCRVIYKHGMIVGFHIGWDATDMAPYSSWKDRDGGVHPVSASYVLDNVMNGIRGLEDEYMVHGFREYDNHWTTNITSKYFGSLYGTPNQIFDEFDLKWRDVAYSLNRKYRREAFKSIKIRW